MFITELFEKISEIFGVSLSLFVSTHRMILGASVRLSFYLSAGISAVTRRIYFLEISHCGLSWKSFEKNPCLVKIEKKKNVSDSCTSVHSVCLSANIRAAPTERIYVKSDIGDFHENMSRSYKFGYKRAKISGTWHEDLGTFYFFCRRCEIAITAPFSSEILSVCYDTRSCINITRTHHNVTLHVHCLSCSTYVLHFL